MSSLARLERAILHDWLVLQGARPVGVSCTRSISALGTNAPSSSGLVGLRSHACFSAIRPMISGGRLFTAELNPFTTYDGPTRAV